MIPPFIHCRISVYYLMSARAVLVVIVDYSADLQMRVDRHGSNIFEPALLQILADPVRQAVTDWYWSSRMPLIQDCLLHETDHPLLYV